MRKVAAVLFFIATLGMLAPPAFAQAPAPAPAPKVTINGLVDFVATYYSNWSGGNGVAGTGGLSASDVTNPRDKGWYTRERGVFTITGEVGRSRGVWAIELDFTNGAGQFGNSGSAFNGGNTGFSQSGTSANFDEDIDVASVVETKWLYIETPATGPGSFLPWIPFDSNIRVGGQPARGIDYKTGILLSGDIPGVTLQTNWTPDIRSTIAFVQMMAKLDPVIASGANQNWATAAALEMDVFKGFTVKPTYAYAWMHGGSCNANPAATGSSLGNPNAGGVQLNSCGSPPPFSPLTTEQNTIGGDVRWVIGGFSLQPTFLYQFGTFQTFIMGPGQFINPVTGLPSSFVGGGGKRKENVSAYLFDTIAGYRIGPLNIQGRVMLASGQNAQSNIQNGADRQYYRAINSAFGYMAGWTDIQTGGVDYITAAMVGIPGLVIRESPSYDKYGRIFFALASDYALTPALTFTGLANASWSRYKVNTRSILTLNGLAQCPATITAGFGNCVSDGRGNEQFLGVEAALGMTYRFAPNVALDVIGSYMWTGPALDNAGVAGGVIGPDPRESKDIAKFTTRLRFTF
jgi:hypothetical protein